MKKNFPIIILLLLLLSSSALFWKSNFVMEEASQGFTMFYFEKTENLTIKSKEDIKEKLTLSIENNKKKDINYEITHFINDQEILKEKVEAKSNEINHLSPSDKLISKIMEATEDSFIYKIKTDKSKEEFELTKKISFK